MFKIDLAAAYACCHCKKGPTGSLGRSIFVCTAAVRKLHAVLHVYIGHMDNACRKLACI